MPSGQSRTTGHAESNETGRRPLNILFLCEGDAETRDSWSGVSQSIVKGLRAEGHTVIPGDVDLYGMERIGVAARTPALSRRRWWVKYHLGRHGWEARSAHSRRWVAEQKDKVDLILQVGATFHAPKIEGLPLLLFCDSNIQMAREGIGTGYSEAAVLREHEIEKIHARESLVYADADYIFTMSHYLSDSFAEHFGVPREQMSTLHCGPNVDVDNLVFSPDDKAADPTILFVGRDFHRKGGDILLAAFEKLRARVPNAKLVMIGNTPKSTPPEGVTMLGFQSRDTASGASAMDMSFRSAHIFCLPTRYDAFGTSFVEAMGYALPCVGPNAWAVPESIADGETGLLVPPEDPAALAEALARLIEDPERAAEMGRAGRERALAQFSWTDMIDTMLDAMYGLVGAQSRS